MEYTIGDVLTVIGVIAGIYVSIWALVVGCALVFPQRAARAQTHLQHAWLLSSILGTALFALGTIFTVVLLNLHNPVTTLLGWALAAAMISLMVVGGSGLALAMGHRIQMMDRRCSPYRALVRSAWVMVIAALLPLFGWTVAAIAALASLGAGFQALFTPHTREVAAAPPYYAPQAAGPATSSPSDRMEV